jgi:succinoglycan biosynthesis transport protein ExoP
MWLRKKRFNTLDPSLIRKLVFAHVSTQTLNHARTVGLALKQTLAEHPTYVLGIISAVPTEGKSTVSHGLAESMATDFARTVVLLDMHAERPAVLADMEAHARRSGLSNWARNECTLEDALIQHEPWAAMPCGTHAQTSRDLLHVLVRHAALTRLREQYDLVLLDLPDLTNPAGAALANLCDGLVLVVRAGKTSVDTVSAALPALQNVPIHGVVLNQQRPATPAVLRRLFA